MELNGTFYRLPKPSDLKRYFKITPHDFAFSVKMSRYITHVKRLSEKQSILDFQKLILDNLENKLQHFLFQLPSSFRYSDEVLDLIVNNVPNTPQSVVEFRHSSWWVPRVEESLMRANITFANVDYPGLENYAVNTSPAFYLRLHGNPVLFTSSYDATSLQRFRKWVPENANDISVYFNNTVGEAGYLNATQFMSMLHQHQAGE